MSSRHCCVDRCDVGETSDAELELLRTRWQRSSRRLGLGHPLAPKYGLGGIASRVSGPAARVLIQPRDPDAFAVEFDQDFWSWFEEEWTDPITGSRASWGDERTTTDRAACLADRWDDSGWRRCLAFHHSGTFELILGRNVRWHQRESTPAFGLVSMVGFLWNGFDWYGRAMEKFGGVVGPWELRLALIGTQGALLGGFAQGWRQLSDGWDWRPPALAEPNLELRRELLAWDGDPKSLAYSLGDQLENAWGTRNTRYLVIRDKVVGDFGREHWSWG